MDWGVPVGHEMNKVRPSLVISGDELHMSPYVVVCPFTSTLRAMYPCEVSFPALGGHLPVPSLLMVQCLRSISDKRLRGDAIDTVRDPLLRLRVEEALARLFPAERLGS